MEHHFTVPVPVDVAWAALLDPERVAPCMPGATLTSATDDEFAGSVKVKLGPVSLMYKGTGTFSKVDIDRHRVVIEASGKDSRGNGTAAATVTALLSPQDGSTEVRVDTDLKVTGKPAQLGRGMISDVAGKLLNQFADCLAERLTGGEQPAAPEPAVGQSTGGEQAAPTRPAPSAGATAEPDRAVAGTPAGSSTDAAGSPGWRVTSAGAETFGGESSFGPTERPSARADAVVEGEPIPSNEAVDLLGTAGAPVLKRVIPALAGIAALAGGVVLLRRRRRRR